MSKLEKKITKKIKKQIAKEIGKQIKNIIEEKVDSSDSTALNFTQKYAEDLALSVMEGDKGKSSFGAAPEISSKKNKKFEIKIKGMDKVAKDVLKGKDVEKAIKDNAGFFVNFKFEW